MKKSQKGSVTDNALDSLDAKQVRTLLRALMPKLDDKTSAWLNKKLIDYAIKNDPNWKPCPSARRVDQIEALCAAAKQNKEDYIEDMDVYFQEAVYAFQAEDYQAASRIFTALPVPFLPVEPNEYGMYDEPAEIDLELCELHALSNYLAAAPNDRPQALYSALNSLAEFEYVYSPLMALDLEELPGFDEFLIPWRDLLSERLAVANQSKAIDETPPEQYWLQEVIGLIEGP